MSALSFIMIERKERLRKLKRSSSLKPITLLMKTIMLKKRNCGPINGHRDHSGPPHHHTTCHSAPQRAEWLILTLCMHAYEMHTYKIHAHKTHAREMHAYEVHAHEVHAHETHAREVHIYETHDHETHAHKTHAHTN